MRGRPDLDAAFRAAVGPEVGEGDSPQAAHWRDYALSSLQRGRDLVAKLQREFTGPWRGRRHLDVGSGWGGTCAAAAEAGATSLGIEIGERQLRAARALAGAAPERLRFAALDLMDWSQLADLGTFDVVTCDNVIEHVPVADRLVAHLARLLAPSGLLYLTVPNPFSAGQVRKDCHYGLFGVSLLDPWVGARCVTALLGEVGYDVGTPHRFETYAALFARYGLAVKLLNPLDGSALPVLEQDMAALAREAQRWDPPAEVADTCRGVLARHLMRWESDLAMVRAGHAPAPALLERDYGAEVWYFAASPDARLVR